MKSKGNAIGGNCLVLRLGSPTFSFHEYIWRYIGVLRQTGLAYGPGSIVQQASVQDHLPNEVPPWTFGPSRPCLWCLSGGNLVRCVSCSPLPVLNTSLFASLFYTLSQDLLGRLGPVDWTSGLRDAVGGSRMMPSFGRLVLFCTFVLFWLVCWYAFGSLYSRHFCVVWQICFYLHSCVLFLLFTMVVCVSEPRFIWSYKNKCIIFTILYSSVRGRSVPIAKFPLD